MAREAGMVPGLADEVTTVVPARTGLVGHPSDAFGGTVLAAPVPELAATVTVAPAGAVEVGDRRFDDLDDLLSTPHEGESAILTAAIAEVVSWMRWREVAVPRAGFRLSATTTIPRSVGLAGSSALVIATIRALATAWGVDVPDDAGPRLALATEVDRLDIAAGPQDRIVQWHGSTMLMDFGGELWWVKPVHPPAPLPLLICWTEVAAPSQATHAPLQQRRDDADVRKRMEALGALAHHAAGALRRGDLEWLGRCMDAGFEHRHALVDLDPHHVAIVEGLRALGAWANYTGSGGAVVALAADVEPLRAWAIDRGLGAVVTMLR